MSAFEQLAPFIQDYIYRNRWHELREVQVAACEVIFGSDSNLLIATPTASGKTEAAFLPVITELYNKPSRSVGILYIAPLKALINDQFVRIDELLDLADIPVTKWHGDASQSAKNKLMQNPQGILQTTPESLEAMLMKRKQQVVKLFSDLRYVVIDEIHTFIASDRGVQLSSILERLQNLTGVTPRRVGLSATLGEMSIAEEWLCTGTNKDCTSIMNSDRRKAQIMLEHFFANLSDVDDDSWIPYYEALYYLTKGRKCIIFSNARSEVEMNINRLKLLAESKKERDVYHVHHGSIAADSREYTEGQMKTSNLPLVTGATLTLELGIDLGDLERIIQTGAPHSVASLAQRLGRSGRRSGVSQMCFLLTEHNAQKGDAFYKTIDWQFIKCIALIELYRNNWIEPLRINKYPFNILLHQTLSVLYGFGEVSAELLAQKLLSERSFQHIEQEDFKELLKHMISLKLLDITSVNKITLGKKGEWLTNSYEFYAVFENPQEFSVREGSLEIGTVYTPLPKGERFVLNGKTWEVLEADMGKMVVYVKFVGGQSSTMWFNPGLVNIHTQVLHKMRDILLSAEEYGYLSSKSMQRLKEIRNTISQTSAFPSRHQTDIFQIAPNRFGIAPWLGTKALNALICALSSMNISVIDNDSSWVITVVTADNIGEVRESLRKIKKAKLSIENLSFPKELPTIGKYGNYIPKSLVIKQFFDEYIDIDEMQRVLVI